MKDRGFTLIELAIGIAIIGILAALAGMSFQNILEENKEKTAIEDLQRISDKFKAIMIENPDMLPDDLGTVTAKYGLPMVDPWGNPYKYLRLFNRPGNTGRARKDRNLVPINTDFDLYSMGPDGRSSSPLTAGISRDDIIRANDGAFLGRASAYDP